MSRARVLLADDHQPLLAAASRLLQTEFDIVATVTDGTAALRAAARVEPDVVVLDISMPGVDGIETARRLRAAGSRAAVVMLTVHDDPDLLRVCLEAGAVGYVLKSRMALELAPAVRAALAGHRFVSPMPGGGATEP
jgi:DNA-binding NarL/FixJ family response regulator